MVLVEGDREGRVGRQNKRGVALAPVPSELACHCMVCRGARLALEESELYLPKHTNLARVSSISSTTRTAVDSDGDLLDDGDIDRRCASGLVLGGHACVLSSKANVVCRCCQKVV